MNFGGYIEYETQRRRELEREQAEREFEARLQEESQYEPRDRYDESES